MARTMFFAIGLNILMWVPTHAKQRQIMYEEISKERLETEARTC